MSHLLLDGLVFRRPTGFRLALEMCCEQRVTAVFGPSGSGKSTLLDLVAGTLVPEAGRILVAGHPVTDSARGVLLPPERRGVGWVPQEHLLFPHRSVLANLRYGQVRRPRRKVSLDEVVEILELGSLLSRRPGELSSGQRQRVALGRAILRGPDLLLLDEPLVGLDAPLRSRILDFLERILRALALPTLFVSHLQEDVRRLADGVAVLEDGCLVAQGPMPGTLDRALLAGGGHQGLPLNLLRLDHVAQEGGGWYGHLRDQRLRISGPAGPGPVWVRFQPSDVALARGDVAGLSVRNHLRGRVVEVHPLGPTGQVLVRTNVGQDLWAELTAEAAAELALAEGSPVVCFVKSSAVRVEG